MAKRKRKPKFSNITVEDPESGRKFDSKKEFRRYLELKTLEQANIIKDLKCQVAFDLEVNNYHICKYTSDFTYYDDNGDYIVEDVKGSLRTITYEFKLKKKLMLALHNIDVKIFI